LNLELILRAAGDGELIYVEVRMGEWVNVEKIKKN